MAKESAQKTPQKPRTEPKTTSTNPNFGDIRGENPNLPAMKNPPSTPPKKSE
jgi:hypothetical protein